MTQKEVLEKLTMDIRLRGLSKDTVKEYVTRSAVFMRHFEKSADEMGEKEVRIFLEYSETTLENWQETSCKSFDICVLQLGDCTVFK